MALIVTKGVMDPINKCLLEADSNPIIHGVHSINPIFVRLTFTSTSTHLHKHTNPSTQLFAWLLSTQIHLIFLF